MRIATLRIQKQNKTVEQVREIIETAYEEHMKYLATSSSAPEGCLELVLELLNKFNTESYDARRICYLAYLLEEAGLKVRVGYMEG